MIHVNGEASDHSPGITVAELLRELDAPERGVAVALDGEVVRRGEWAGTAIADGTRVEVVVAVQGG